MNADAYMSHNLNSLQGSYIGDYIGEYYRMFNGDTGSSDDEPYSHVFRHVLEEDACWSLSRSVSPIFRSRGLQPEALNCF